MARSRDLRIDLRDPEPDDSDLLTRLRNGDDTAYGELWARYAPQARRVAVHLVPRADVDDLVSEVFERTYAAIKTGHGPESAFMPYLSRALRARSANVLARNGRVALADTEGPLDSVSVDPDPFQENPVTGRVFRAFGALPARWQEALWYAVVEGTAPRHLAAILETTPNGASAVVIRARKRLRDSFIELSSAESHDPLCAAAIRHPRRHGEHLLTCAYCQDTLEGLTDLDIKLRALGALPVAVLLIALHRPAMFLRRTVPHAIRAVPAKVAVVAGVGVTAAGLAVVPLVGLHLAGAVNAQRLRPPTVTRAVTASTGVASQPATPVLAPQSPLRPASPVVAAAPARANRVATAHPRVTLATGGPKPAQPTPAPAHRPVTRPVVEPVISPATPTTPASRRVRGHATAVAACGCVRIVVTDPVHRDVVVVLSRQRGVTTVRRVVHPSASGALHLSVFGARSSTSPMTVQVIVLRRGTTRLDLQATQRNPRTR